VQVTKAKKNCLVRRALRGETETNPAVHRQVPVANHRGKTKYFSLCGVVGMSGLPKKRGGGGEHSAGQNWGRIKDLL